MQSCALAVLARFQVMTTELWEQDSFGQEVDKKECKCTPNEHKNYELPILRQYKLMCDRVATIVSDYFKHW